VFVFCLRQTTFHFPFSSNEAVIQNSFGIGFRRCKIRFVMEKGSYNVSGETIQQVIENDRFSVVDVYTEVAATSGKKVMIYPAK
jgi:hypothetical protein